VVAVTARVLSYPPVHDYVDRLHPEAATLVHRDEDWPLLPRFYDPRWLRAHRSDWDVAHLHFTWEQHGPETFAAVLIAHRTAGTPVVWTAHDLRNPHTRDGSADDTYLRLLAREAEVVLTLTPGAAEEVRQRFARDAVVVPHGPVLASDVARRFRSDRRTPDGTLRLLVHGKSLRAGLDWRSAVEAVRALVADGLPVELELLVHAHAPGREEVERAAGPGVRVKVHEPLTMPELCARLVAVDALVLPYRWGTHSGLVELAADLGLPVVAADVGYLRDQRPALCYPPGRAGLKAALQELCSGPPQPVVPLADREADRRRLVEVHRMVYDELAAKGKARRRAASTSPGAGSRTTATSDEVQST
jgi:beta-1,4-mannosyltransferase